MNRLANARRAIRKNRETLTANSPYELGGEAFWNESPEKPAANPFAIGLAEAADWQRGYAEMAA